MKKKTQVKRLLDRYQRLRAHIRPDGFICHGSVIKRRYQRKVAGRAKRCGPFYSWTRKMDNKTVTMALSEKQYRLLSQAIARHRKIERTLTRMRTISEQNIFLTTPRVSKRNR